ncbi:MAG: A/G-specific adenine glycosylase, partial [Lachnospiraceae bacterium]|nr:A/G-specific adenine glycosylase [Lachnospiraceae bacterium]
MHSPEIAERLLDWYHAGRRVLPWRESRDPYHIWVSEIMLQQTRVEAVKPYYDRFLKALPTIADLAKAEEESLLKLWEGLGYYNRVRNLQKAACILMEQYDGQMPADYGALLKLPGIGSYTAGAVASIAFGIKAPAV